LERASAIFAGADDARSATCRVAIVVDTTAASAISYPSMDGRLDPSRSRRQAV
jgi:hypothetical protein